MSSSSIPADCDASTMSGTQCRAHSSAISYIGRMKPNAFDTWVHTTSSEPGMSRPKSSRTAAASKSRLPATETSAPAALSGRVTELCSKPDITVRVPRRASEAMAIFSAWVAFIVVLFMLPPASPVTVETFNYAPVAVFAVVIFATVSWFVGGRKHFMVDVPEGHDTRPPNELFG